MTKPIAWFCVNLKNGGLKVTPGGPLLRRHGSLSLEWLQRFPDILDTAEAHPDVIFLQEARWYDHNGDELLLYVERLLRTARYGRYRGFLTRSTRSAHHQALFIRTKRLDAAHHWRGADPDESRGLHGFVEVVVDGDENKTLWLKSVHLDPRDGDGRLAEAKQIQAAVPLGQRAIIAGDFNSITSRRPTGSEPQRQFSQMPTARRFHKGLWPATKPDGDTEADTRAVDYLIDCGWMCQHIADRNITPTTTDGRDRGGELIIDRCLTFGALSTVELSVSVDTSEMPYSDHRAVSGALEITDPDGGP